jgi:hypothetical protein
MSEKISWKNFWKESSTLVAHTLLSCFYLKAAQVLFDYYRIPLAALLFLAASIFFALPLIFNLVDSGAKLTAALNEPAFAEKILKASIAVHRKLFGSKNIFLSEKQAMLAALYFETGRISEAEALFKESWDRYGKSTIRLPWMHTCFADYARLLSTRGDTTAETAVRAALKKSDRFLLAQRFVTLLATLPVICFLMVTQEIEHKITSYNNQGKIDYALLELTRLAKNEALVFGEYGAARVYTDYALNYDQGTGRSKEVSWCAEKALSALRRSGKTDEYLQVLLLNLKARSCSAEGCDAESKKYLQEAVALCLNWDREDLSRNKFDAVLQRDKAVLALAELERTQGSLEKAEALYRALHNGTNTKSGLQTKIIVMDTVEAVDRLHKLQDIELKLGKKDEVLKIQEEICNILEAHIKGLATSKITGKFRDTSVREVTRELDVCALLMREKGRTKEAKEYQAKSESLRNEHIRPLKLNAVQQDSIVDATTKVTGDLLSVKYKAGDWQQALSNLLNNELISKRARGAFEHLPWYDADSLKAGKSARSAKPERTLTVDIAPLSVRNSRDGDFISVDVQGTVKIFNAQSQSQEEERFGFAYIMKAQKSGRHSVEDLADSQSLAQVQTD